MRLALLLPLGLIAAACGSSTSLHSRGPAPARGSAGPPPAWIETKGGTYWLGFSSWCWTKGHTGVCADMITPECGMKGVPEVPVNRGEQVQAHLGYTPEEASVEGTDAELHGRMVSWHVKQAGPFLLFTSGRGRDASYAGCAAFAS